MNDNELILICSDIIVLIAEHKYLSACRQIKILNDHILDAL